MSESPWRRAEFAEGAAARRPVAAPEAEAAAGKLAEARVCELLDAIGLAVVILDRRGHVSFCNGHLAALVGAVREEVVGTDWFGGFLPPDCRDTARTAFLATTEGRERPPQGEYTIPTRRGERRLIAWHCASWCDPRWQVTPGVGSWPL